MQRLPEEPVEDGAACPRLVRGTHLAEDLALTGHERVEPGRDAEEVERRRFVAKPVELDLALRQGFAARLSASSGSR